MHLINLINFGNDMYITKIHKTKSKVIKLAPPSEEQLSKQSSF